MAVGTVMFGYQPNAAADTAFGSKVEMLEHANTVSIKASKSGTLPFKIPKHTYYVSQQPNAASLTNSVINTFQDAKLTFPGILTIAVNIVIIVYIQ